MIQTGKWPRQWVKEEDIVPSKIEKTKQPANEDHLQTRFLKVPGYLNCAKTF